MLIKTLAPPSSQTQQQVAESSRLKAWTFGNLFLLCRRFGGFEIKEQEQKLNIYVISTNRNAIL